jgi:hypothetical protein
MQRENYGRLLGKAVHQLIAEPNLHKSPRRDL